MSPQGPRQQFGVGGQKAQSGVTRQNAQSAATNAASERKKAVLRTLLWNAFKIAAVAIPTYYAVSYIHNYHDKEQKQLDQDLFDRTARTPGLNDAARFSTQDRAMIALKDVIDGLPALNPNKPEHESLKNLATALGQQSAYDSFVDFARGPWLYDNMGPDGKFKDVSNFVAQSHAQTLLFALKRLKKSLDTVFDADPSRWSSVASQSQYTEGLKTICDGYDRMESLYNTSMEITVTPASTPGGRPTLCGLTR